jgi:hypothetical protein
VRPFDEREEREDELRPVAEGDVEDPADPRPGPAASSSVALVIMNAEGSSANDARPKTFSGETRMSSSPTAAGIARNRRWCRLDAAYRP